MKDYQKEIRNWMEGLAPALARLYEGAVRMLEDKSFPGRVRFIAHGVREIRNRLPEVVAGKTVKERLIYSKEFEAIVEKWEAAGLSGMKVSDEGPADYAGKTATVPYDLFAIVSDLVSKHRKVRMLNIDKAAELMLALEPHNKQAREGLIPVVKEWHKTCEWFVGLAHESGTVAVSDDEIAENFKRFEATLHSFAMSFLAGLQKVESLIDRANEVEGEPDEKLVSEAMALVSRPQYLEHFFSRLDTPSWLAPLKEKGFFTRPPGAVKTDDGALVWPHWLEAPYLTRLASKVPEEVVGIINGIKTNNPLVIGRCIECLLEMPEINAANGVTAVKRFFAERKRWGWFVDTDKVGELMVKLSRNFIHKSCEIAYSLLEVWKPEKEEGKYFAKDIQAKFEPYQYDDLIFKHYSKLWDVDAVRALQVLVRIFDKYQDELGDDDYDVRCGFQCRSATERLDQIGGGYRNEIVVTLIKAICEAGRAVIEKQPEKIGRTFDYLWGKKKVIFERIVLYLLRFVPEGSQTERINSIVGDPKFLEERDWWYEYRLLLNDKFENITDEAIATFREWVQAQKVEDVDEWKKWFKDTRKGEPKDEDLEKYLEKYEARMRAKELYPVRDKFPEFAEYIKQAGIDADAVKPQRMVSEARHVDSTEGAAISEKEMEKMEPDKVIKVMNTTKKWGKTERGWHMLSGEQTESQVFRRDVKKRVSEYLRIEANELLKLPAVFLYGFFEGIWEAVRGENAESIDWDRLLEVAGAVVEKYGDSKEYNECLKAELNVLREAFDNEDLRERIIAKNIEPIWNIIEPLTRYCYNADSIAEDNRDPLDECINCVQGKAFQLSIRLGVICKNRDVKHYESWMANRLKKVLEYILEDVELAKVRCVFGLWFPQIYWLEEKWVEGNLDRIFNEKDNKLWDCVWGTYISWGRTSRPAFDLLADRRKYDFAINRFGKECMFKYREDPEKGVVEHLMIALFSGWIEFEHEVLKLFFEKAPAKLRGYAAGFFTTGFKPVKEKEEKDEKEKITQRARQYWKARIEEIAKAPEDNLEEAVEFAGWVNDSLLPPKETFELLKETLDLTGGKIGERKNAVDFVKGICEIGEGNELAALECLNWATNEPKMGVYFSLYRNELTKFMERVANLENDYKDVGEIRREAMQLADTYGRMRIYDFKDIYERLSERG